MKEEIEKAVECIRSGGVLLYPTDTIWGLGCDATNDEAVQKILELKNRGNKMGLILLVERDARINRHVDEVPAIAWDLMDVAERPLTIVYPGGKGVSGKVMGDDGSVAMRMVKDVFCEKLIQRANVPIVSTSANLSGQPAPKSFSDIDPVILGGVDYAVNLRRTETMLPQPSDIIKVALNGEVQVIR